MKLESILALALICTFAFSACTKSGGGASGGHNSWTIPGTVRVGNSDEPDSLNPLYAHTDAADQVQGLIYSSLLRYDDNGNYIPDLATQVPSYENGGISKDSRTITVHMRKGVKWSDGAPLTAKDFLFTYHTVMNPANTVKTTLGWDDVASVQTPNDYTIVIHLKEPDASFLGNLAFGGAGYPPLPEHVLANVPDLSRAEFNSHPISSGPYVLQQWNHGSLLVFVPNPYYFRGKPRVQKILWKVIPDVNTLFNQLQTHQIDVETAVNENDIPRIGHIQGITVSTKLIANWRHMGINMSRPILKDPRVRLALAEAINWQLINDKSYHGYNQLATSDIFPQSWAAPAIARYKYDPQDAKRLLSQAGWAMGQDGLLHKNGEPLRLSISTGTNKQENIQAEVQIQSQLRPLGVDVVIRNYPVSLLFDRSGPLYTGKYDLEWSINTNGPDPDNACEWVTDCIPPHGSNTSWLSDPVVDQTAHAAAETFDRAKRKALYQREEERIHELIPAVFFYWENEYNAVNSDLKNFKPAAFIQDTWNSWQWEI